MYSIKEDVRKNIRDIYQWNASCLQSNYVDAISPRMYYIQVPVGQLNRLSEVFMECGAIFTHEVTRKHSMFFFIEDFEDFHNRLLFWTISDDLYDDI